MPNGLTTSLGFNDLHRAYERANHGHTCEEVWCAGVSVAVNAIKQEATTRQQAEKLFDDLFGRAKQQLIDSYMLSGGRRTHVERYPDVPGTPERIERILSLGVDR